MCEVGVIKWLCENLFFGWINLILIILVVYFVIKIVIGVYFWFVNGVWEGSSCVDCVVVFVGEIGVCFVILVECWN